MDLSFLGFRVGGWGTFWLLGAGALALALALLIRAGGDRLRIDFAVLRYDAWLDLRGGVGGRRRRHLRRELRANLLDASAEVGGREAVRRLGSLRQLALDAADASQEPAGTEPRWARGATHAATALAGTVVVELLALMWWTTAAHDSGAQAVTGSLVLFPGSAVGYTRLTGGVSIEFQPGWLALAAAVAAFAVTSRPWRLRTRRAPA